ncbi:hypothetical protein KR018_009126 [Drosophila ironensis]|nr:hypothetical protein KR018_009126 [Drosophila ironensis]
MESMHSPSPTASKEDDEMEAQLKSLTEPYAEALRKQFSSRYDIRDMKTPTNAFMSGRYKRSFAYHTLHSSLPVILTNVVDTLTRDKTELVAQFAPHDFAQAAREELKIIIGLISRLKYELQTDKTFLDFTGDEPDLNLWNSFLGLLPQVERSFFRGCSLHAECYMHRKLSSFFENSIFLKNYDCFGKLKRELLTESMEDVMALTKYTRRSEGSPEAFAELLKINVWSSLNDEANDPEDAKPLSFTTLENLTAMDAHVLVNDAAEIWECLEKRNAKKCKQVDYVLDNAGYELFCDFLLAEYLIEKGLATSVRFHVKAHTWFVTDATERDFRWTLDYLSHHSDYMISLMGKKFLRFLEEGLFELAPTSHFWTSPYPFYRMIEIDPELYGLLRQSKLVVLKGELNSRKLLQDVSWKCSQETSTCLRGFLPTNICLLRRLKSEVVCGLPEGMGSALSRKNPRWMVSGSYGLIQFVDGSREFGY